MEAVVLAGGLGTRLREVVSDRPKPMATVAGRPFLEWIVRALSAQGVVRAVLCTGHMGEKVEAHFQGNKDWGLEILCSRERTALGTWGATRNALPLIEGDRFFVLNGDSLCRFDCAVMSAEFSHHKARALIWLVPEKDSGRYGIVRLGSDNGVIGFSEKSHDGGTHLISAGVYLLERDLVAGLQEGTAASFERDLFPNLVGEGLYGIVGNGPFLDIGTPDAYARAEEFVETIKAFGVEA